MSQKLSSRVGRIFAATMLLGCSSPPPQESALPAESGPYISDGGWILLSARDPVPNAGDTSLYEQSYSSALKSYLAEPPSLRRNLGLGQAHLALGRLDVDLLSLAIRFSLDLLERQSKERRLGPEELGIIDWCKAPQIGSSGLSEHTLRLLGLDDASLVAEAEGKGFEILPRSDHGRSQMRHPAELAASARLHLRLAHAYLSGVRSGGLPELAGPGLVQLDVLLAATSALAEPLESGWPPSPGRGPGAKRECMFEAFRFAASDQVPEGLSKIQTCVPSNDAQDLGRNDPSWLILRALLRYQEGSCNSYALAAVDLAVLEKTFPEVPGVASTFRQLYARDCSVGGRLAGG